jgi:hypothetical protein
MMDPWATHIPVLVSAVSNTSGAVIELGCGDYSTPVLHLLCKDRTLISAESDEKWLMQFMDLSSKTHNFFHVNDWANFKQIDQSWDVAFVDHAPGERRKYDIERLRDKTRFVVVHDSEAACYGYESVFATFKHRIDYKRYNTWTSVLSNNSPILFL